MTLLESEHLNSQWHCMSFLDASLFCQYFIGVDDALLLCYTVTFKFLMIAGDI